MKKLIYSQEDLDLILSLETETKDEEIERLNKALDTATEIINNKHKEIVILNNIINELEKYIDEDDWTSVNGEVAIILIKHKIKELKGSDKE